MLSALFGSLLGSACVLTGYQVIYYQDLSTLEVPLCQPGADTRLIEEKINGIHQRINDFYFFEGIVITLLLTHQCRDISEGPTRNRDPLPREFRVV